MVAYVVFSHDNKYSSKPKIKKPIQKVSIACIRTLSTKRKSRHADRVANKHCVGEKNNFLNA